MGRARWIGRALVIGLAALSIASAAAQFPRRPLNDRMTWEEINDALDRYPPNFESGLQRMFIAQSMDHQVDFSVKDATEVQRKRLVDNVGFYRRRLDHGLRALERVRTPDPEPSTRQVRRKFKPGAARRLEDVLIVKFYLSSIVLCTPTGSVAIDFCQGPVGNNAEPEAADPHNSGFFLSRDQRDRLARSIDVQLITQRGPNHADYSLAKRMVAAGKRVVGPAELKTIWPDLADGITVPDYEKVMSLGPCEIYTQRGAAPVPAGAEPGARHDDFESIRYLIRIGGMVFLHAADNTSDPDPWLAKAHRMGWRVDAVLSPGGYQGVLRVPHYLESQRYFQLPIHEYDLLQAGGGNRASMYFIGKYYGLYMQRKFIPLLWGESFLLSPQSLRMIR